MKPLDKYTELYTSYAAKTAELSKKSYNLGTIRLVLAIAIVFFTYKFLVTESIHFLGIVLAALALFVILVIKHRSLLWQRKVLANLAKVNQEEIGFLSKKELPFYDGSRNIDPSHFYTFDLDFFGKSSLFHHLNRTASFVGQSNLASLLTSILQPKQIVENQAAVKELTSKLEWRQDFAALGKSIEDKEEDYNKLISWTKEAQKPLSSITILVSYSMAAAFLGVFVVAVLGFLPFAWVGLVFVLNLAFMGTQLTKIRQEVINSQRVSQIIKYYGFILHSIEKEKFISPRLVQWQDVLLTDRASKELQILSNHFLKIQGINFQLGAIVLNGTVLYHIHALRSLLRWKEIHAAKVEAWLEIIGQFEGLSSLANFAYNNPSFIYPSLNQNKEAAFTDLGHPLIDENTRVTNSIRLTDSNFVILTGSNMSGKSTFLRTLGVNMVLAGIGSPICASSGSIHPLPVLVSMRQSDSLSSGESYFFAEVKRLKTIISHLETETCFVLLDEILRGTNSDDKQSGTIGVIKKIISKSAIGGIATHDLEVCKLVEEHPQNLENKNFEVEIINDELVFDYKLRKGICKNKSATFLMKKMEII